MNMIIIDISQNSIYIYIYIYENKHCIYIYKYIHSVCIIDIRQSSHSGVVDVFVDASFGR